MARLLLLASLVISTSGCGTFSNLNECQDKDRANGEDQGKAEELELRDGGPTCALERPSQMGRDSVQLNLAAHAEKAGNRSPPEQQVRLRVMIAELDRPAARALGFASASKEGDDNTKLPWILDNGETQVAIKLVLKKLGYARILSEPLEVQNWQAMMLLSGREFEIVQDQITNVGRGTPFGVQVNLTPIMMDGNRIRLEMHAKIISTRMFIGGTLIPGSKIRNLTTTIEMHEGQTFAVAGLIENNFGKQTSRQAFLAGIPILNRLVETDATMIPREIVLLVTPEIVQASAKKE